MFIEGGKHSFSIMIYEFYSNGALYSASLSFKMFIFLFNNSETVKAVTLVFGSI